MPSIALPVSLRGQLLSGSRFSPVSLFAASEPGVWYDPSDLTTMFQDTAGTTPVTTSGQTVALLLDKSKGLVLGTELVTNGDFSNPVTTGWVAYAGASLSVDSARLKVTSTGGNPFALYAMTTVANKWYSFIVAYDSAAHAGQLVIYPASNTAGSPLATMANVTGSGVRSGYFMATGTTSYVLVQGLGVTSGVSIFFDNISVRELPGNHATQATAASRPTYGIVPLGGRRNLLLATDTMATQSLTVTAVAHTLAFTGTGTVTLTGASIAGPLIGTGASNRVSLTFTPTAASLTLTVVGSVTLAQLELGSTATAYQRVTTQYDVTETGVQSLSYLAFDGVDDGMATGTITPGVDKAQVFAGVRKLSDATAGPLVELSANIGANTGSFYVATGPDPFVANRYSSSSRGSGGILTSNAATTNIGNAPDQAVLSSTHDIAGDLTTIRRNGVAGTNSTLDLFTGNFLAYPLYIGRRGGTTNPFNGQIYNLIVRFGTNLDAGTITSTETFVNGKTGAF
jgi:hypothetical protein